MKISFMLAGKPMAKGRVRFNMKTGHAFTPERTVNYEGQLAHAASLAMAGRAPIQGALGVRLDVYMPIPKSWPRKQVVAATLGELRPTGRPDLDNFAKMLDSCNHILWNDDSQIVDMRVVKFYDASPRMTVTVWTLDTSEEPL